MAYKSGNPALTKNTFNNISAVGADQAMTLQGVANKSLILLILCLATGAVAWRWTSEYGDAVIMWLLPAILLGLVVGLVTVFKKTFAPVLAPAYAIIEGFVLGVISQLYNAQYEGIVVQAIVLTAAIFFAMLTIYRLRIIKATENFKLGIFAATGGIMLFYLASIGLRFFGIEMPLIHESTPLGIAFSIFVVIIATLNLVVDFDFIEQGVNQKAPKYMEWYSSFGLFVTLVWLYLEILRLLAKLRR